MKREERREGGKGVAGPRGPLSPSLERGHEWSVKRRERAERVWRVCR